MRRRERVCGVRAGFVFVVKRSVDVAGGGVGELGGRGKCRGGRMSVEELAIAN